MQIKLSAAMAALIPALTVAHPTPSCDSTCGPKPPAFFLAGDSTTAVQSEGGGGWGNGFLSFLRHRAWGINFGHNGATTRSFVDGGDWANVTQHVRDNRHQFDVYVTIQVSLWPYLSRVIRLRAVLMLSNSLDITTRSQRQILPLTNIKPT